MSDVRGIDFVALQVRDIQAAARFYTEVMGLQPVSQSPPDAVVFATQPIPFAVRTPLVDLESVDKLGWGVALWFRADDTDTVYRRVRDAGRPIVVEPNEGPFGRTFAFVDPDGYSVTVHDKG